MCISTVKASRAGVFNSYYSYVDYSYVEYLSEEVKIDYPV